MREFFSTLDALESRTVGHYEASAQSFWEGTRDHDVSQNREALLRHLTGTAPFRILDFGCGPGRDLKAFRDLGHEPIGLDAAPSFCEMARNFAGCEVWHQHFLSLTLPEHVFDGVFANASLFHVPTKYLAKVLGQLYRCLKPQGVFFASNPRGNNEEGWNGSRYGVWHHQDQWHTYVTQAGFEPLEHYFRPPGKPCHEQPWLATVWRKP